MAERGATIGPIQSIPADAGPIPGSFFQATNKFEWLSSILSRVGFTSDRWLVYGTGATQLGDVRRVPPRLIRE